jgi:hypothetical protein
MYALRPGVCELTYLRVASEMNFTPIAICGVVILATAAGAASAETCGFEVA